MGNVGRTGDKIYMIKYLKCVYMNKLIFLKKILLTTPWYLEIITNALVYRR